jgi:uncharacterized protein
MKLHSDRPGGQNQVTGYERGKVFINGQPYTGSILLLPDAEVTGWSLTDIRLATEASFEQLHAMRPEVLLIGTGERQHLIHPKLWGGLTQARIGVDFMDTRAACRTYNLLSSEGRRVLAALIIEPA